MANDLLYKASLHLGASPQNKRSTLLYKIPTVGNRQHVVHTDRIRAMQDARKAVEKYQAQAIIRAASQHRGPNPGEQDLVVGDTVLTFRKNKGWIGPFQLISLTEADGEVRDSKGGVTVLERTRIKKFLNPYPGEHEFLQDFRASVLGPADIHVTDEPLSANSILPEEFAGVTPEAADCKSAYLQL
jgi:hypothetical protein